MSRPIWKGHISFALVNIPVALFSAEKRADLHFHLVDSRNQARVHYERINDETGQEVPWNKVVKAFEFDKNNYVVLSEEELKQAAPKSAKTIDIENFVSLEVVNPMYFERPYYLVPEKNAEKGYVLLREVLKQEGKIGIAKIVIRAKQYLAAVIPIGNALVLNLLRFDQEIIKQDQFDFPSAALKSYQIRDREIQMTQQLIQSMAEDWQPSIYHDDYRDALMQWIEEKASHGKRKTAKTKQVTETPSNMIDFMSLLEKSLGQKNKRAENTKRRRSA